MVGAVSNDLHIRLLPDGTNARVDAAARAYANVAGVGGTIADRRRARRRCCASCSYSLP